MIVEKRRRLHDDHFSFHYDLILRQFGDRIEALLDSFCGNQISVDQAVKVEGEIRTDDGFRYYIILRKVK